MILFFWFISFIFVVPWGILLAAVINKKLEYDNVFDYFWCGYIFIVGIVQFISLVFPIGKIVFGVFVIVSILLLIVFARSIRTVILKTVNEINFNKKITILIGVIGYFAFELLYSASKNINWYDTNLYHLNAVDWSQSHKAVVGLANLHIRLGFNSSFFVYSALFDNWVYYKSVSHVVLSSLVFFLFVQMFLYSVSRKRGIAPNFSLLMIPFLVMEAWGTQAASLSTDLASFVFVILTVFYLLIDKKRYYPLVILLAIIAITTKLSAILIVVVPVFLFLWNRNKIKGVLIKSIVASLLVYLGYVLRNIILSGWIIFPSYFGYLNLPWSVSVSGTNNLLEIIKRWARYPGPGFWTDGNGYMWFYHWFGKFVVTYEFRIFAFILLLAFLVLFFGKAQIFKRAKYRNSILGIFVSIASLVFWFIQSPDIRFSAVFFWVIFALVVSILLTEFPVTAIGGVNNVFVSLAVFLFSLFCFGLNPTYNQSISLIFLPKSDNRNLGRMNVPGADQVLYFPVGGSDQCGDSPLPCTPDGINFKLIDPNDFSKGFLPNK